MSSLLGTDPAGESIDTTIPSERRGLYIDRRAGERRRAPPAPETAWRSSAELVGYALWAKDGLIGQVTDLCYEEESLTVTGIVALARRFFLPVRLFVPLGAVTRIDAAQRRVDVRLTRAQIRQLSSLQDSAS
jgi:hypothetical protein